MMGEGYAVVPSNEKVYAPVNGKVTSIFETQHAIGILTDEGLEVLVHMGLDTVELNGLPFTDPCERRRFSHAKNTTSRHGPHSN